MSLIMYEGLGFLDGLVQRVVPCMDLEQKVMHSSVLYPSAIEPSG